MTDGLIHLPLAERELLTASRYRIHQVKKAPVLKSVPEERHAAHGFFFGRLTGPGDVIVVSRADLLDALIENPLCSCGLAGDQHHKRDQLGVVCTGFSLDEQANQWEIERGLRWLLAHPALAVEAEVHDQDS